MQSRNYRILDAALCACFVLVSCQRPPEQRYDLKGSVVAVDKDKRQVTVAHEPIKGFMDAMTMPFNVRDDWALTVLTPGQEVEATLVVQDDRSWIEGLRITETKNAPGTPAAAVMPKIGDEVPDFALLNQDGRRIHLGQYRGRPLLLTFIYTRCPLPDYCPRTSKNFSEIYQGLQSMALSDRIPHLLTISFDTDYDTPAVLRDYAARYMNPVAFGKWEFATGSPEEIKRITSYFGLVYSKESGQIIHSLVTALIGADGKLARLYLGNQWTPRQILDEFR
jgi:protein SCO1/2